VRGAARNLVLVPSPVDKFIAGDDWRLGCVAARLAVAGGSLESPQAVRLFRPLGVLVVAGLVALRSQGSRLARDANSHVSRLPAPAGERWFDKVPDRAPLVQPARTTAAPALPPAARGAALCASAAISSGGAAGDPTATGEPLRGEGGDGHPGRPSASCSRYSARAPAEPDPELRPGRHETHREPRPGGCGGTGPRPDVDRGHLPRREHRTHDRDPVWLRLQRNGHAGPRVPPGRTTIRCCLLLPRDDRRPIEVSPFIV
jgi:hypothetical protein